MARLLPAGITPDVNHCMRCGEKLKTVVWLELSCDDGEYYEPGKLPEGHESQGLFEFGTSCAKRQLSRRGNG